MITIRCIKRKYMFISIGKSCISVSNFTARVKSTIFIKLKIKI